jgi:hypothetical protein
VLYPHVQRWTEQSLKWTLRAQPKRWLKVMDSNLAALAEVKRQFPLCRIWYRRHFPGQWLDNPILRARSAASAVLFEMGAARQHISIVSSYNETGLNEQATAYRDFEAEYARLMHTEGLLVCSYNFSVEQPLEADIDKYLPISGDFLGLNQYNAPRVDSPFVRERLLRHMRWLSRPGCPPVLIGETGIDRGVLGESLSGWLSPRNPTAPADYCDQLRWLARLLSGSHARVLAAFVFNVGIWPPWETFEVAGHDEIADVLAEVEHLGGDYPIQGGTVTATEIERYAADLFKRFNVDWVPADGFCKFFLAEMKAGRFLGPPMEAQHRTENGQYVYQAFANAVLHAKIGEYIVRKGLPPLS